MTDLEDLVVTSGLAPSAPPAPRWRAKVYKLRGDGEWADCGTGYVEAVDESPMAPGGVGPSGTPRARIAILSDTDARPSVLLADVPVGREDTLKRSDTIITWEAADKESEVALSFQENLGCNAVWEGLCAVFGVSPDRQAIGLGAEAAEAAEAAAAEGGGGGGGGNGSGEGEQLAKDAALGANDGDDAEFGSALGEAEDEKVEGDENNNYANGGGTAGGIGGGFSFTSSGFIFGGRGGGASFGVDHDLGGSDASSSSSFPSHSFAAGALSHMGMHGGADITLPKPELTSIVEIRNQLQEAMLDPDRTLLLNHLLEDDAAFLRVLFTDTLKEAEDLGDVDVLRAYHDIADYLTQLSDTTVLDVVTSDGIFEGYVGALEYSPDASPTAASSDAPKPESHRSFFRRRVRFRQVVPITDPELLTRIHQNFRIQYIKDAVLPRNYSDNVLSHLGASIVFNATEICDKVLASPTILQGIAGILKMPQQPLHHARANAAAGAPHANDVAAADAAEAAAAAVVVAQRSEEGPADDSFVSSLDVETASAPSGSRRDALHFLLELVALGRSRQAGARGAFFKAMNERLSNLCSALEPVIGDRHATCEEVVAALEILLAFVSQDATPVREYVTQQRRHPSPPVRKFMGASAASSSSSLPKPMMSSSLSAPASLSSASLAAAEGPAAAGAGTAALGSQSGETVPSSTPVPSASASPSPPSPASPPLLDDGASIRLEEKLRSLGLSPDMPGAETFNIDRRKLGEHGRLVEHVSAFTPLLHKLVWRAVDDPDPTVQGYSCDVLRAIVDLDPNALFVTASSVVEVFLTHYMPWLITPFTHADLPDAINHDPAAGMAALRTMLPTLRDELERSRASEEVDTRVVQALASGFDGSMGLESQPSKHSKGCIAELVTWCFGTHVLRMKTLANRCSLYTNMLRLARYREKHLVVMAVKFIRQIVGIEDALLANEVTGKALLSPIAAAFLMNSKRPNLLHSVIAELFTTLRSLPPMNRMGSYVRTNFEPLFLWANLPSPPSMSQIETDTRAWPGASQTHYGSSLGMGGGRGRDDDGDAFGGYFDDDDDDDREARGDDDDEDDEDEDDEDGNGRGGALSSGGIFGKGLMGSGMFGSTGGSNAVSSSATAITRAAASGGLLFSAFASRQSPSSAGSSFQNRPRDELDFDEDDNEAAPTPMSRSKALRSLSGAIGSGAAAHLAAAASRSSSASSTRESLIGGEEDAGQDAVDSRGKGGDSGSAGSSDDTATAAAGDGDGDGFLERSRFSDASDAEEKEEEDRPFPSLRPAATGGGGAGEHHLGHSAIARPVLRLKITAGSIRIAGLTGSGGGAASGGGGDAARAAAPPAPSPPAAAAPAPAPAAAAAVLWSDAVEDEEEKVAEAEESTTAVVAVSKGKRLPSRKGDDGEEIVEEAESAWKRLRGGEEGEEEEEGEGAGEGAVAAAEPVTGEKKAGSWEEGETAW